MNNIFFRISFMLAGLNFSLSYAYGMEQVDLEQSLGIIQKLHAPFPDEVLWNDQIKIRREVKLDLLIEKSPNENVFLKEALYIEFLDSPSYVQSLIYGKGFSFTKEGPWVNDFFLNVHCQHKYEKVTQRVRTDLDSLWTPEIKQPENMFDTIDYRLAAPHKEIVEKFLTAFSDKNLIPQSLIDSLIHQAH